MRITIAFVDGAWRWEICDTSLPWKNRSLYSGTCGSWIKAYRAVGEAMQKC
jgi:hypothetical protein